MAEEAQIKAGPSLAACYNILAACYQHTFVTPSVRQLGPVWPVLQYGKSQSQYISVGENLVTISRYKSPCLVHRQLPGLNP